MSSISSARIRKEWTERKEVELTVMEGMRKLVRESAGTMSTLRRAKHRSHAKIDALNA